MKKVDDEEVMGIVEDELDNQLKGELVRKDGVLTILQTIDDNPEAA